jgi:hypothetical protein
MSFPSPDLLAYLTTAGVAGCMTLFDLDRQFYIPRTVSWNLPLNGWWWGFVSINAGLACACYALVHDQAPFNTYPGPAQGVFVGLSYLALVRLKFATVAIQGKEVALGLEPAYEAARGFFLKRINAIALDASNTATLKYAKENDLQTLIQLSNMRVAQNRLYTPEERQEFQTWIQQVASDKKTDDMGRRIALAYFILSGFRS